jgi:hypothetical protein
MISSVKVCLAASGLFLMCGMLTGVWKYAQMAKSPRHQSHIYVDFAHRASLLYSFAAFVFAELIQFSPYSETVQLCAVGLPLFFFATAVANFVRLGITQETTNQFQERNFNTTWGIYLLAIGEIAGFSVILWGFLSTQIL